MKSNIPPRHIVVTLLVLLVCLSSGAAPQRVILAAPSAFPTGPVAAPSFGLNTHLATRYPDPSSMDVPTALVQDLGVSWVREDFHWHRVEPHPGAWDWTFTDAAMRQLLSRDINVLGVLGPSVGWATPYTGDTANDVSYYPPDPDKFVEYVRGVVSRYHRYVDHWEVWNEPDSPIFWRSAPDPAAYADLLIRTSAVIKAIDPDAKVLIGGFNPFDTTFFQQVLNAGAWDSFDIIAIHPYVDPYGPEDGNIASATASVWTAAQPFGYKPIWVTELGWSSGAGDRDRVGLTNEDFQASYLVRSMLLLWHAGAEKVFWYSLKDDADNPYGLMRYGTGRTDYSQQKPAFEAFRTLNQELAGASFVERRDLFSRLVVQPFERVDEWRRTSQPNGVLRTSTAQVYSGNASAELSYNFTTRQNDYVAFERDTPIPLTDRPYAVGMWVYGDGSTHNLKLWVQDAEGEVLQFVLGAAGSPGWHFLSAPIGGTVEPGNRIRGTGNGRVDFPASVTALVLDDAEDRYTGSGTIYLDDITLVRGHETYDFRFQRNDQSLDILWSPPGVRLILNTRTASGWMLGRNGGGASIDSFDSRFRVNLGPSPVYLWHQR